MSSVDVKPLSYLDKLKLPGNEAKYERYIESKRKYREKMMRLNPDLIRNQNKARRRLLEKKKQESKINSQKKESAKTKKIRAVDVKLQPRHEIFLPSSSSQQLHMPSAATDNKFDDYQNKCRCCFEKFSINSMKIVITDSQRDAFKKLTGVKLQQDPAHSKFFCQRCCIEMTRCQDFINRASSLQKEFEDFVTSSKLTIKTEEVLITPEFVTESYDADPPHAVDFIKHEDNPIDCIMECSVKLERYDFDDNDLVTNLTSEFKSERPKRNASRKVVKILSQINPFKPRVLRHEHLEGDNRLMFCDKCDWTTDDKRKLLNHVSAHLKAKIIDTNSKCDLCDKIFTSSNRLAQHISRYHKLKRAKKCVCPICNLEIRSNYQLERHVTNQHPEVTKTRKCKKCTKGFFTNEGLNRHLNMTHYAKIRCTYLNCSKRFIDAPTMRHHISRFHEKSNNNLNVPCEICGRTFDTNSSLNKHKKRFHDGTREVYKCDTCDAEYVSLGSLNLHKVCHLKSAPDIPCDLCGKMFYTDKYCQAHKKKCGLEIQHFPCEYCGKIFRGKDSVNLSLHIKYVHRKFSLELPCRLCGKKFPSNNRLTKHKKSAHGDERQCDICGEKFHNENNFKRHQFINHQNLRYHCVVPGCLREYSDKQKIKKHLKLHHKELSPEEQEYYDTIRLKIEPTLKMV